VLTLRRTPLGVSLSLSCSSLRDSTCASSSSESRLSRVAVAAVTLDSTSFSPRPTQVEVNGYICPSPTSITSPPALRTSTSTLSQRAIRETNTDTPASSSSRQGVETSPLYATKDGGTNSTETSQITDPSWDPSDPKCTPQTKFTSQQTNLPKKPTYRENQTTTKTTLPTKKPISKTHQWLSTQQALGLRLAEVEVEEEEEEEEAEEAAAEDNRPLSLLSSSSLSPQRLTYATWEPSRESSREKETRRTPS
jgi:hypothetical protein